MFAGRAGFELAPNELTRRVDERRRRGLPVLDLSDANPTHFGLAPEALLRRAVADVAGHPGLGRYDPEPRGDAAARAAVAAYHARLGADVRPEHVILTAGTSEGYAHLFRLLADPGDVVHVPTPGYPLFEHLAAFEGVEARPYPLRAPRVGARWRVDLDALAASLAPTSRAVVAIDPHNPTGSFVDPQDWASLRSIARERGLALISDEVFADTARVQAAGSAPLAGARAGGVLGVGAAEATHGPLRCVVSGASKPLSLPQLKLGWIVVAGPSDLRDDALARLEFLADAYLSVSPLLARALPALLEAREEAQAPARERAGENRAALEAALEDGAARCLPAEAGFVAIVELDTPSPDDEAVALRLLDEHGVLAQPGFWFDLAQQSAAGAPAAHLVVSLLPRADDFARGVRALRDLARSLRPREGRGDPA